MKKSLVQKITLFVLLGVLLGAGGVVQAESLSAPEILTRLDESMRAEAKMIKQDMTLISANGQKRTRELQMWSRQKGGADQMLARFLAPADVRGTGILMDDGDMWLYLPALGRVRRVASHAKKGSFMGSDLSYDDMEQLGSKGFAQKYEASSLGEAQLEGSNTFVLELLPIDNDGDYTSLKMWVDQEVWLPRKIEYYGEGNTLLKVLSTFDLQETEGRWMAQKMIMEDQQKGSQTVLDVTEVSFSVELDDSLFTTRNLERGL